MVLSNDSSLLINQSPRDWALSRQNRFLGDLIDSGLSLDKHRSAVGAAKERLSIYEKNLEVAEEFARVDEPLLKFADDQESLVKFVADRDFDSLKSFYLNQDLSERKVAQAVSGSLSKLVDENFAKPEILASLLDLAGELDTKLVISLSDQNKEALFTKDSLSNADLKLLGLIPKKQVWDRLIKLAENTNDSDENAQNFSKFQRLFRHVEDRKIKHGVLTMFNVARAKTSLNPLLREYFEFQAKAK